MGQNKKTVLITGANRGIGFYTGRQMGSLGYHVILTGRKQQRVDQAVKQLQSNNLDVYGRVLDLTNDADITGTADWVDNVYGYLNVLINNAAIYYDLGHKATKLDFTLLQEAWQTNLVGAWKMVDAFLPLLQKAESPRIVNVSSGSGSLYRMGPGTPAYAVTKTALNVMTIKLAHELKSQGILVNAVDPGWVRTDMGGPEAPRSVGQGAESVVWAATLDDNGPTGGFFRDGKAIEW